MTISAILSININISLNILVFVYSVREAVHCLHFSANPRQEPIHNFLNFFFFSYYELVTKEAFLKSGLK